MKAIREYQSFLLITPMAPSDTPIETKLTETNLKISPLFAVPSFVLKVNLRLVKKLTTAPTQ